MKKTMVFAIMAIAAIIIVSSLGIQISPHNAIKIPASYEGAALFVCPVGNDVWAQIANGIAPMRKYIKWVFFFLIMILMANWGWALYQNLLSDKFKRDSYSNVWSFTKMAFWAFIIITLVANTPNHYRVVHINGTNGDWVLCESNSPNARAVRSDAVIP